MKTSDQNDPLPEILFVLAIGSVALLLCVLSIVG